MNVTPTSYVYGSPGMAFVGPDDYAGPAHMPAEGYGYPAGYVDGYADDYADDYGAPEEPPGPFQVGAYQGLTDGGLLLAMALVGAAFDPLIERKTGARGFGAVIGATVGNAVTTGISAGSASSVSSGFGVMVGGLLPLLPVAVAVGMGKEITGTTRNVLLGTSALAVAIGYLASKQGPK